MRVLRLEVENFRGVQHLDWKITRSCACLIGPGDSGKSTILEALERVLSPRWNLQFEDSDFHDCDTSHSICIKVTLGAIPAGWESEDKFGLLLRGWSEPLNAFEDEPREGFEPTITIQLRVDASLEPQWAVVNDRNTDGVRISSKDRECLPSSRLGPFVERHLTWGKGSALSRITADQSGIAQILTGANRDARASVRPESLPKLQEAADKVTRLARVVGVIPKTKFQPILDSQAMAVSNGSISLHDGETPTRLYGLGSRRLVTLALQREHTIAGGAVIVDEVEHGLEPHRLRRLLRIIRSDASSTSGSNSLVVLTTHSPIAVSELRAEDLGLVRNSDGEIEIKVIPDSLQNVIRSSPEAFLAPNVIVCEGMTELGFCKGLDEFWWGESHESFAAHGIALANGGGCDSGPKSALELGKLGFGVLYFGDSDRPLSVPEDLLRVAGIKVILWNDGLAFEQRLTRDLTWPALVELLNLAYATRQENSVRQAIASRLNHPLMELSGAIETWTSQGIEDAALRDAIGTTAIAMEWFKRADLSEPVAGIVMKYWDALDGTDLKTKVASLKTWAITRD